jgi:hypothetical protein
MPRNAWLMARMRRWTNSPPTRRSPLNSAKRAGMEDAMLAKRRNDRPSSTSPIASTDATGIHPE